LLIAKDRVEKSNEYTKEQKDEMISAINERYKKLSNEK